MTRGNPWGRTLSIQPSSASKTPRRASVGRCRYCGHLIEWFDRFQEPRVPLVPREYPVKGIPLSFRWTVENGVARLMHPEDREKWCWIAHPAVCPFPASGEEPSTARSPMLEQLRRAMKIKTRTWQHRGRFVPHDPGPDQTEPVLPCELAQDAAPIRDIIKCTSTIGWLARGQLNEVQCVALTRKGSRCANPVLDPDNADGSWVEERVPTAPGRAGQLVLAAGDTMWIYQVNVFHDLTTAGRWQQQRCPTHSDHSTAPSAVGAEWEAFNVLRHSDHIRRVLPEWAERPDPGEDPRLLFPSAAGKARQRCATSGCYNGTAIPQAPDWTCWQCDRRRRKRAATHRRWQQPGT
ncbi:DUF6083 domain-containing protein [Streptomyces sp. DSM 44917]|uniref:DUF6083 domain-containing protein n=1 Tax=Streptomyces boetiae TaxID=3075541 RepID=A0ABU2L783_9ACTN|nr:DUF6083 domain-containing protein [Streptomyces sp. DSM 44917]MDT0307316.1 DUF6083 domain-containing protein [Streptomyces sp. DSM 44917]